MCAGNGGYGRLGHVKQQDEFKPRNIETFNQRNPVAPDVVRLAASASAFNALLCVCLGWENYTLHTEPQNMHATTEPQVKC